MDADLFFVIGIVLLALAFPAVLGAVTDKRAPRAAAILIMVGGSLLAIAIYDRPNTYAIQSIPDVFVRVVARYIG